MKTKIYKLELTEAEINHHLIKRAVADLVAIRMRLQSAKPFYEVSEAEVEVLKMLPLFTSADKYPDKKYPKEVGKHKGKAVVLKEK